MNIKRLHPILRESDNVEAVELIVECVTNKRDPRGLLLGILGLLGVNSLLELNSKYPELGNYLFGSPKIYKWVNVDYERSDEGYVLNENAHLSLFDPKILRVTKTKKPLDPSDFSVSFVERIINASDFEREPSSIHFNQSEGVPDISIMGSVMASFSILGETQHVYLKSDGDYLMYRKIPDECARVLRVNKMCNHSIIVSKIFDFFGFGLTSHTLINDLCDALTGHNLKLAHVLHREIETREGERNDCQKSGD